MADPHLRPAEARHLVAYLPPRQQAVLEHALECATCRRHVAGLLGPWSSAPGAPPPSEDDDASVWEALAAAREQAAERLAAERGVAEPALAELLAAAPAERLRRIRRHRRYRSVSLAGLLLERGVAALAAEAPEEAKDLALLAVLVLERLDSEEEPQPLLVELRVCAWGLVAHACWSAQRWDTVIEALERAEELLVEAGHSARHLGFRRTQAAFRLAERRAADAFARLARAVLLLVGKLLPDAVPPTDGPDETRH